MKPSRWSYSSLRTYETCPAKWKYEYIDGLKQPPSSAMERGTNLHALCESYLKGALGTVPQELEKISEALSRLRVHAAVSEHAWRLDVNWSPVDHGGWIIGIVDVHFVKDEVLHIYDFKSGNPYPDHTKQLELYALLGSLHRPEVEAVQVGAIYIDSGKVSRVKVFKKPDFEPIRIDWHKRAERIFADEDYIPTPGRGCFFCSHKDIDGGSCTAYQYRPKL